MKANFISTFGLLALALPLAPWIRLNLLVALHFTNLMPDHWDKNGFPLRETQKLPRFFNEQRYFSAKHLKIEKN